LFKSLVLGLWHGRGHRFDPDQVQQVSETAEKRDTLSVRWFSMLKWQYEVAMKTPLIAIVGRLSSDYVDKEPIRDLETLREALSELGTELAIAGFRIMVYTADPQLEYAAQHVVAGYRHSGKAKKKSIVIRRPEVSPGDQFPEEQTDPCYERDIRPSESWEITFYLSLFAVDGVLAVGNGSFTYIGGLHAIGDRMPLLALGGFGGVAHQVLMLLSRRISADDYELMAQMKKGRVWAKNCVESLKRQTQEASQSVDQKKMERELGRSTWAALLTGFGVLAILIVVGESLRRDSGSWFRAYVTALLPAIAGLIGGVQRVIFGLYRNENLPIYRRSFALSGVLGFSAGGFAGAIYTLSQAKSFPTGSDRTALSLLALWASTFGYVAGLSLEKVFVKLMGIDVSLSKQSLTLTADKKSRSAK
jgi:hypothetical protein